MPQSLSSVYVHLTFSTKDRFPFIDNDLINRLYEYLGGTCKGIDCTPLKIGGHSDHVHILCLLSRKITQMKLVEEVKKQSSRWIKTIDDKYSKFSWQRGYGIFSVNPTEIEKVISYIENQEERHKRISFKDESRAFLRKYDIPFDERYVWD